MKRSRRQAQAGFTLVEMLVTLAVVASAMAALAWWNGRSVQHPGLREVARDIHLRLRQARRQAMVRGENAFLVIDARNGSYWTSGARKVRRVPPGIRVLFRTARELTVRPGQGRIVFFPDGSSSGGIIRLSAGGDRLRIEVDWLTGRIRSGP